MAEALREGDFDNRFDSVNKWQTIWVYVGRVVGTWNESVSQQNQPTRQTTLYVPLRIVCCLGSRLECVHCHNLMHFVHKLMHTLTRTQTPTHFAHKLFRVTP